MAKYLCVHEVYERYSNGGTRSSRFEAESDVDALCKVIDNCMYEMDYDCDEDGNPILPDLEDCISRIEGMNGDGCDYILRVERLSDGKVLFEAEDYSVEDEDW